MDSSKILPVEIDTDKLNEIEHGLWRFPSCHIAIGKVASGKSTFLHNLITRFWLPVFEDRIILFSPTAMNDPIIYDLIENNKIFINFDEYNYGILQRVLETIEEDDNPKHRYLIVFDDAMGQFANQLSYEGRMFNKFVSNFRHIAQEGKLTLYFSIQKFSQLPNVLRCNAHYLYLLGVSSEKELKFYSDELNAISNGSSDMFMQLYHQSKQVKYDVAFLDFIKLRFMRNFNELLHSENDDNLEINKENKENEENKNND